MIQIFKHKFIERLITNKKVGIRYQDGRVIFQCEEQNCIFTCNYQKTCKELFHGKTPNLNVKEGQHYIDEYPEFLI